LDFLYRETSEGSGRLAEIKKGKEKKMNGAVKENFVRGVRVVGGRVLRVKPPDTRTGGESKTIRGRN